MGGTLQGCHWGSNPVYLVHLSCAWRATISAGMALCAVLLGHVVKCGIEAQVALVEEFKGGLGWFFLL